MTNLYAVKNTSLFVFFILFICEYTNAQTASLQATFDIKADNGITVPYQNGMPVPTFEKQNRQTISLDGQWRKQRFNADHNISLAARDSSGYANLVSEAAGRFESNYDDSNWDYKNIPSVENTMYIYPKIPELYENGVWYRRSFFIPDSISGKFVKLIFYAVNYTADVWVNGHYLGYHEGGYTSFAFDVSRFLNYNGENIIAIRVDDPPWGSRNDIVPYTNCDWYNYTGIIHDVYLEISNEISVVRADIVPLDTAGNIQTTLVLLNKNTSTSQVDVSIDIFKANIDSANIRADRASELVGAQAIISGNNTNTIDVNGDTINVWRTNLSVINPALWSPKNPNLYVMKITLKDSGRVVDEYYTQFGIRTVVTDGINVLLNGKVVFFTGIARHEDHPVYGRAVPDSVIYSDLVKIKGLNANMIRTAHYPNDPYTYLIADRLGFAIIEEIPVWWFDDASAWIIQNSSRHIHQQMFREMVFRDYNRPSILYWSTCNECLDVTNRAEYIKTINNDIKNNYNDGRLITESAAADRPGPQDASEDNCDVMGWTMYFGIFHGGTYYDGTKQFMIDANTDHPNKPILDTEFGYWSTQTGSTELQQAQVFYLTFKAFAEAAALRTDGSVNPGGFLTGVMWWCAFDWYTVQSGLQTMGIYSMDRNTIKKVGAFVISTYKPYFNNGGTVTSILKNPETLSGPYTFSLLQNYPNPFNPGTSITFSLAKNTKVKLTVFNVLGEEVANLIDGKEYSAGVHVINANLKGLSSGVYFYRIVTDGFTAVKKMVFLK